MANSDKNIVITPNINQTAQPKIVFTGADGQDVTLSALDSAGLSISGASGQLFSVIDNLTGTIFSVNDISGVPSLEIDDDGTIRLAEFAGNVLIGTATDNGSDLLQVDGSVFTAGSINIGDGSVDSRLVIKRVDGTAADDIQFYNGTTRVGEIGTGDTTWLRINQDTAKNIYTPRYIRADGGFFVDGTTYGISGTGVMQSATGATIGGNTAWHAGNDGSGSGLDADLLDGQQGSYYQPASSALTTSTTFGGDVSGTYNAIVVANDSHTHDTRYYTESEIDTKLTNGTVNKLANATSNAAGNFHMFVNDGGGNIGMRWNSTTGGTNTLVENGIAYELEVANDATSGDWSIYKGSTSTGTAGETISWTQAFRIEGTNSELYAYGSKIWHEGNDGSGSGLDADLLDGQQGSYYLDYNNFTNTPTGGGGITYVRKTTTYTAAVNDGVIADTSGGAWTLTLPASPSTGDVVVVADGADWSVNNLTVARNGSTIEGDAANMTMDIGGAHVTFIYDGTTWEMYTQIGAVGGSGVVSVGSAWSITDNAGNLLFAYNGVNKMKLDTSGNLTVVGDVTTAGTI